MVQDRGSIHRERFEEMDEQRVFFVLGLRRNLKITHVQPLTHPAKDSPVFQDMATTFQGTSRPFRIVSLHDDHRKSSRHIRKKEKTRRVNYPYFRKKIRSGWWGGEEPLGSSPPHHPRPLKQYFTMGALGRAKGQFFVFFTHFLVNQ